jgi:hypothetical protein
MELMDHGSFQVDGREVRENKVAPLFIVVNSEPVNFQLLVRAIGNDMFTCQ